MAGGIWWEYFEPMPTQSGDLKCEEAGDHNVGCQSSSQCNEARSTSPLLADAGLNEV